MLSGRELLVCLKSLSDQERREALGLLLSAARGRSEPDWSHMSGLQANQEFFARMTREERDRWQQSCLFRSYSGLPWRCTQAGMLEPPEDILGCHLP